MKPERASAVRLMAAQLLLCLCIAGFAQAAAPALLPDPGSIRFKPLSFEPPRAERLQLENGMILYVLPDDELPLVKIRMVLRSGSMYDPPGREGVAEMTAAMLATGGVEGISGDDVDEELESMAAAFHASVTRESTVLSLSVLKKDLNSGVDLFSRIVMRPAFEEAKLALAKGLKIEELRRIADDPQKLAFREFGRLMHAGTPRGRLSTAASIRSIQRSDLLACQERYYHPGNTMISVSGDIGTAEARQLVERHFGGWRRATQTPDPPSFPSQLSGGLFFLTKDVPQSVVVFGWLAPSKREADFYPFEVLDFLVGSGGFRSRIFQEIRTNLGLAYSTGSFYSPKEEYGLFGAYAMTKSAASATVASRIGEILREMARTPVSPGELEGAKQSILNSYIFSFTSAEQIAFQQLMLEYQGLPPDRLTTYPARIGGVKSAEVQQMATRLDREKPVLLIVGNEEAFREVAAKLGSVSRIVAEE